MRLYEELWIDAEFDKTIAQRLAHEMGLFLPVANVLASRGIETAEQARAYLHPVEADLDRMLPLTGTKEAAEFLLEGVERGQRFLVYGDYDVDGVTSTLILTRHLERLGAVVQHFIPDRQKDGYGVSLERLQERIDKFDILVTVDCGITAVDAIKALNALGKRVLVTDHHEPKAETPDCLLLDPRLAPDDYQDFAGVGVVYQLIREMSKTSGSALDPDALAFAAIGTVADQMPLTGWNRLLVKLGLEAMAESENPGLRALIETMGLDRTRISAGDIAYRLGPAINAAGRIGSADEAIRLFTSEDTTQVAHLAKTLKETNETRKGIEKAIVEEAGKSVDPEAPFILVRGEDWHDGVIGIVASRLVERFRKPAVVMTRGGQGYKGSGRSVGRFHLLEALESASSHIRQFGGHRYAAGLSIDSEAFEGLREALNDYASSHLTPEDRAVRHVVNGVIPVSLITPQTVESLSALEPFGRGNPKPLFRFEEATVLHMKTVGREQEHLKMNLQLDNRVVDAMGFGLGGRLSELKRKMTIDLVGTLDRNVYMGVEYINIYLKDFRESTHRTLWRQPDVAAYIEALTDLVRHYHLPRIDKPYVALTAEVDVALRSGKLEVVPDPRFDGRVDFTSQRDLREPRHRLWFESELIRKLPQRGDLVELYQKVVAGGEFSWKRFDESTGETYNWNREVLCGQIFSELGLMEMNRAGQTVRLTVLPHDRSKKMDLKASRTFRNAIDLKEDWDEFKRQNPCD